MWPADYASRSPPACRPSARAKWQSRRLWPRARYTSPDPSACNSVGNAGGSSAPLQLVTVTHPFHPYSGQRGVCIAKRGNRAGKRWLLRFDDGQICSIPPQWTDAATPDPEVVAGVGRALCSLTDLLELSELVARLMSQKRVAGAKKRKDNYAEPVREKTPQSPWGLR